MCLTVSQVLNNLNNQLRMLISPADNQLNATMSSYNLTRDGGTIDPTVFRGSLSNVFDVSEVAASKLPSLPFSFPSAYARIM